MDRVSRNNLTRRLCRNAMAICALGVAALILPATASADDNSIPTMPTAGFGTKATQTGTSSNTGTPWAATFGVSIPGSNLSGVSTGYTGSIGYTFNVQSAAIRAALRGNSWAVGGGTLSFSEFDIDALFKAEQFWGGVGIGWGQASFSGGGGTFVSNSTDFLWALTVGFDFTTRLFLEGRWESVNANPTVNFTTISIGYRF